MTLEDKVKSAVTLQLALGERIELVQEQMAAFQASPIKDPVKWKQLNALQSDNEVQLIRLKKLVDEIEVEQRNIGLLDKLGDFDVEHVEGED